MLAALSVRDIVLIDRLDIDFRTGFTALTGETGAGKSLLLDALSLALGGRGDAALVRSGCESAQTSAAFYVPAPHSAREKLKEHGLDDTRDVILRRVQGRDGRSRAFVNGQPVSISVLREIGSLLVELHGQHDDRALVDPGHHRGLLDAFAELEGEVRALGDSHTHMQRATTARAALGERLARLQDEREFLVHALSELRTLKPLAGEEETLATTRQEMMRLESLRTELNEARETLAGEASPIPVLSSLSRRLQRRAADNGEIFDAALGGLDAALDGLETAAGALEDAIRASEFEPDELERIEERLFALRALARKHNVPVDALADLRRTFAAELAAIEDGDRERDQLDEQVSRARADYHAKAATLSRKRARAAGKLQGAVNRELPALKLGQARFFVDINKDETRLAASGYDSIAFRVRTNTGAPPGPMMKVASGGELSRLLLALKVVLADKGSAPCLVFDEIDTGVGGAVADAMGKRLRRLSARVQVLAITHAPQVAALADHHCLITKGGKSGEGVRTHLKELDDAARREELARMLAGEKITREARAAAAKLLTGTHA